MRVPPAPRGIPQGLHHGWSEAYYLPPPGAYHTTRPLQLLLDLLAHHGQTYSDNVLIRCYSRDQCTHTRQAVARVLHQLGFAVHNWRHELTYIN